MQPYCKTFRAHKDHKATECGICCEDTKGGANYVRREGKQIIEEELKAMSETTILRNSIRTPDGTHLVSRDRHDYVTHEDKNGEHYMVDGGNDYLRRSANVIDAEDTSLYSDDPHELLRKEITWGTFGRDSDAYKINYIKIMAMSRAHIDNIIQDGYTGGIVEVMRNELVWRDNHEKGAEAKRLEIQRENSYG